MKLKLVFLCIIIFISIVAYQKYLEYSSFRSIDSYESCVAAKSSTIQESYPATCTTKLGNRFVQDSNTYSYTCPASGYIDCMPGPGKDKSKTCSQEAMSWYRVNCPDFQGAAL